jgi:hypothetical protein
MNTTLNRIVTRVRAMVARTCRKGIALIEGGQQWLAGM